MYIIILCVCVCECVCVCKSVCFGRYNILLHLINPANHSHSLALGVHLDWNDWSMLYPTSPPPQRSDPVGPCTVHFYLLTNFFLRMYLMHILCVKPFAVYACSRDQLVGASDSLQRWRIKHFCGYPTLPALSTSFPTGQVNTIGVVYKCACMSTSSQCPFTLVHRCTQLHGVPLYSLLWPQLVVCLMYM